MKKKLFACMLCVFTCTTFAASIGSTQNVFAVDSAFSTITLETTSVKEITTSTNLSVFRIVDKSRVVAEQDTIYSLKLSNGFMFENKPEIVTYGKYNENVSFEIDYQNPSIAYITVQKKTDDTEGIIEIHNLDVAPTRDSEINKEIILTLSGNNTFDTIKVGTYKESASSRADISIQTLEGGKKPSATGTSAPNRKLQVRIDDEEYGNITSKNDGTWSYTFPYKYSSLESGKHTFTVGYFQGDDADLVSPASKEFEIEEESPKNTITVSFTVGEKSYTYDGRTGYLQSPAFIDSHGRTLLPLRAVAATLGVDTPNIQWDNANQTITISMTEKDSSKKTIRYKIGSNIVTINGVDIEMDTAPVIQNGVTFLPLRSLLNSFGITDDRIQWDANTFTVSYEVEKAQQ